MVWKYASLAVGVLVMAFAIRQMTSKRKYRTDRIDVGPLSDSWLAEMRSHGDDRH
jgi:hypothetical protein